jgi:TonB family protein
MRSFFHLRNPLFLLVLLSLSANSWGQEVNRVPASEAARHLLEGQAPQYPQMAKIAHIQGKTVLELTVAPDGSVTQLHAVSGHPILLQAALDAVRQWKYDPVLLNGTAAPVRTLVYLLFTQGADAELQQKYFSGEIECRDRLHAQRFEEAGRSCNAALETAKSLKSDTFGFKMNAFGNAGLAANHLHMLPEALENFQERVKLAKKDLQPDSEEWFDVHHDLALAFQASNQVDQAETEYRETERVLKAESKALESSGAKEYIARRQEGIRSQLRLALTEHEALLRQMGRSADADELKAQAKSLSSSK